MPLVEVLEGYQFRNSSELNFPSWFFFRIWSSNIWALKIASLKLELHWKQTHHAIATCHDMAKHFFFNFADSSCRRNTFFSCVCCARVKNWVFEARQLTGNQFILLAENIEAQQALWSLFNFNFSLIFCSGKCKKHKFSPTWLRENWKIICHESKKCLKRNNFPSPSMLHPLLPIHMNTNEKLCSAWCNRLLPLRVLETHNRRLFSLQRFFTEGVFRSAPSTPLNVRHVPAA